MQKVRIGWALFLFLVFFSRNMKNKVIDSIAIYRCV